MKKTEREAARFLPLLATASAVHNFCRRSAFYSKKSVCGGTANSSSNLIGRRSRFSAVHKHFPFILYSRIGELSTVKGIFYEGRAHSRPPPRLCGIEL